MNLTTSAHFTSLNIRTVTPGDEPGVTAVDIGLSASLRKAAYEQAVRQRWRALALLIKSKLEAVESGITVFEEEFMAHVVLPDGKTVGQHLLPQIAHSYESGHMPPLLPGAAVSHRCVWCDEPITAADVNAHQLLPHGEWIHWECRVRTTEPHFRRLVD